MKLKAILHYKIHPLYLSPLVLLVLYSVFIEPNWIEVKHQEIINSPLSTVLSDRNVILISDLHIRDIGHREKALIEKINNARPDLVFIAGEFTGRGRKIEDYREMLSNVTEVLKQINSKYGIYAVYGEGDLYAPSSRELLLRQALKEANVKLLSNEQRDIEIDNKKLSVLGLGITFTGIRQLFTNTRKSDHPVIVLSHKPRYFMSVVDALEVNLAERAEHNLDEWAWQDNAYWSPDSPAIYFEHEGEHTVRVLRREDGVAIDQILLTPYSSIANYPPGLTSDKCYIPQANDILIPVSHIDKQSIHGSWVPGTDEHACNNTFIEDWPDLYQKVEVPEISNENYFEATFQAKSNTLYHVWLRMKANRQSSTSDSVYLQFSDSLDSNKTKRYQINRTLKDIYKAEIILAGDNHGGQVRFPFSIDLLNFLGADIQYDQGLFNLESTDLYVTRGIGWSVLPIRMFCRPEITQLHFRSNREDYK